MPHLNFKAVLASALLGLICGSVWAAASDREWQPLEGSQGEGVEGDAFYAAVYALHVFDDGLGSDLYVGGYFGSAGGMVGTASIARWDGQEWSALGFGRNGVVYAMETFDDGGGPALFAGGVFGGGTTISNTISRWDGVSWTYVGDSLDGVVYALAVFDDGNGPALYAGGQFTIAGDDASQHLARWDGETWSAVGGGLSSEVRSLHVFDDGSGSALFVGGRFSEAGDIVANGIARWDGTSWSALGTGIGGGSTSPAVLAITDFDEGSGSALYVGGRFTQADGQFALNIARWNGSQWMSVGSGVGSGASGGVSAFSVHHDEDDDGSLLYVGGSFFEAGGTVAWHLAYWDGQEWNAAGPRFNTRVNAFAGLNDAVGSTLYAGGHFLSGCGQTFNRIAKRGVRTTSPCPGDINRDGVVDLTDLNILIQRFGMSPICGDTNNDSAVDLDDLNIVLSAFGTTCPD